MRTRAAILAGTVAMFLVPAILPGQNTSFDEFVDFGDNLSIDWFISSTSDPAIGPTGSSNGNPTLSLEIGKRYRFNYPTPIAHPFTLMAKGSVPASDTLLLVQGSGTGSEEGTSSIDWHDTGTGDFYFNLSPELADLMQGSASQNPGYRCNVHTGTMRGDIVFRDAEQGIAWPSGTEDFEGRALGENVQNAFTGWAIVTDDTVNYTATISDSPAAATGQDGASTRWMTINDAHDANSAQDRVYPASLAPPTGETVSDYTFEFLINIESFGTANSLVITQHDNSGSFTNLGGLQITPTGVNAIIIGTDDGGIGKAGASVTDPLYAYTDSGGFSLGDWVTVSFTIDLTNGNVDAAATGSDGSTQVTAQAAGLALQGAGDPDFFRMCIRNTGTGNTSVISYDNISFNGNSVTSGEERWLLY